MSEKLFVYDATFLSPHIFLYGRSTANETICWKVQNVPMLTLYLELDMIYLKQLYRQQYDGAVLPHLMTPEIEEKMGKLKLHITNADLHKYIPALDSCEIKHDNTLVMKNVAPLVSFNIQSIHDTDVPTWWDDDERKVISVPEDCFEQKSLIHKARPSRIAVLKVQCYCNELLTKGMPHANMDHGKIHKAIKSTEMFQGVWRESLTPLEVFSMEKNICLTGSWIECPNECIRPTDDPKPTSCAREYFVPYHSVTMVHPSDAPSAEVYLNYAIMTLTRFSNTKIELNVLIDKFFPNSLAATTTPQYVRFVYNSKPDVAELEPYMFKQTTAFGHAVDKMLLQYDIHIVLGYKWTNWIMSKLGNSKFNIRCNRLNESHPPIVTKPKQFKMVMNRSGIVFMDLSKYLIKNEFFPKTSSTQLAHLAHVHLGQPFQIRIVNGKEKVHVVYDLVKKFSTIHLIYYWSRTCFSPWQLACDAQNSKLAEWNLNHEYYHDDFILRHLEIAPTKTASKIAPVIVDDEDEEAASSGSTVTGGHVFEPDKGVHKLVMQLDFESDYPNIIKAANLCPSTLTMSSLKTFSSDNVSLSYLRLFRLRQTGKLKLAPLPALCEALVVLKKMLKQQRQKSTDVMEQLLLDVKIKVTKLSVNTIYGCFKAPGWRFYNPALAEYITALGRMKLQKSKELIEADKFRVIAGDTDSLFVKASAAMSVDTTDTDTMVQKLKECANQICEKINAALPGLNCEPDQNYAVYAAMRKKNYVTIPFFQNKIDFFDWEQCDWKGLPIREANVAPFVTQLRMPILFDILFYLSELDGKEDEVKKYRAHMQLLSRVKQHVQMLVERFFDDLMSPEDFILTGNLRKELDCYSDPAPHQVQVARLLWELANENFPEGEYMFKDEMVEMIACYDFTRFDDVQFYPAHIVMDSLVNRSMQINTEWYLTKHLVEKLSEFLTPFQFYSRETLQNDIQQMLKVEYQRRS